MNKRNEALVDGTLDDIALENAMAVEGMEYVAEGAVPKAELNTTPVTYNAILEERPVIHDDSFIALIIQGAIFR